MILESEVLSQFFHNLEFFSKFPTLLLLQVILISWSNLVQMWQWTIFSWIIGHDTWYLQKFQFCPLCIRWNLIGETLIFNCAFSDSFEAILNLWMCFNDVCDPLNLYLEVLALVQMKISLWGPQSIKTLVWWYWGIWGPIVLGLCNFLLDSWW